LTLHFGRESFCQLRPVYDLNDIEQCDSFRHLVGLQRSNEMKFQIRITDLSGLPPLLCFLNTVFTKNTMAG
jgi:hypothetical protein